MKAYQVVLKGGLTRHIGAEGFREGREGLFFQLGHGNVLRFARDEVIQFEEEGANAHAPDADRCLGARGQCDRWGHYQAEGKVPQRQSGKSS